MKRIKTVVWPASRAVFFDSEVNDCIADGWQLKKRELVKMPGEPSEAFNFAESPMLYAELEKETPPFPEEVTA
ncbi:MAG: hypothetical protein IKC53_04740 [Lentisphaeria bacterium]|nr:hypothetical protein [Lentisphaeria bacterium]